MSEFTDRLALRFRQIFDWRFAVDARKQEGGQKRRCPLFDILEWHAAEIGGRQRVEAVQERGARRRRPQTFQKQMVQAEGEVKRRVAVPSAFRIEKYRSVICDEDVLRADVAVHQTHLGISRAIDEGLKYLLKIAMRDPRRHEVRLEADRMEDGIGRETLGDLGAPGGRRMDRGERGADLRSEGGACVALSQALLPYRQRQVLHGECACRIVGREDARRGAGRSFARGLEPEPLVTVALDRRFPDLRDTQARERALHAHVADLPDFRGDAAAERFDGTGLEPGVPQKTQHRLRERGAQWPSCRLYAGRAADHAIGRRGPARTRFPVGSRGSRPSAAGGAAIRRNGASRPPWRSPGPCGYPLFRSGKTPMRRAARRAGASRNRRPSPRE